MIVTIAPMVVPDVCEPPYLLRIFRHLENELNDDYHFIIGRTNVPQEAQIFHSCIKPDKKNILFLLSDEAGIIPPYLNELSLVFRTYSNKRLYDNDKIFAIPCGFSCGYGGRFGKTHWSYIDDMEKTKKPLIEREYDIFYSGQIAPNRISCVENLNKIKDKFKTFVNVTGGFAQGLLLEEYYNLMQNSKIAIVPNGAVVPESFRYFEAFESNCIVISSFPVNEDVYNNWFYDNSPAIFVKDWSQLTEELIRSLLTDENLQKYEIENRKYFDKNISTKGIAEYILNVIKNKNV